jgi:DNA mismatch endonuclease, patch repair protein
VDGSFWHGHPSKWQPGRWKGYWNDKIKRNIARDAAQNAALAEAGWNVLRFWDFEVEQDSSAVAHRVLEALGSRQPEQLDNQSLGLRPDAVRSGSYCC